MIDKQILPQNLKQKNEDPKTRSFPFKSKQQSSYPTTKPRNSIKKRSSDLTAETQFRSQEQIQNPKNPNGRIGDRNRGTSRKRIMITSTVGFPRLSKIWRALMHLIVAIRVAIAGKRERESERTRLQEQRLLNGGQMLWISTSRQKNGGRSIYSAGLPRPPEVPISAVGFGASSGI